MSKRVSLCMAVWNTAHLLKRTLRTLVRQTYDNFEVIVIDDNSEDDVEAVVAPYYDKLDIKVHRLVHNLGMRGNTVSFNTAFGLAQGEILMENTPEILLYPRCIEDLVGALERLGPKSWVSVRTYNLAPEDQMDIGTVDWESDLANINTLPKFNDPWTQNNVGEGKEYFGTHQTCVIFRDDWFKYIKRFPLFCDYGSDDPFYAGARVRTGIQSATLEPLVYHQWHAAIGYWMCKGKAPNWNKWGHTMKNHYNDPLVPEGGTSMFWDQNQPEGRCAVHAEEEKEGWAIWDKYVKGTGFRRKE